MVTPAEGPPLPAAELSARARRVRLLLTDCDGVLTDATVYYSAHGEEMKRFSLRDGMGVERLRRAGIETAILTGEVSAAVQRRSEKLKLPWLFEGVADKLLALPRVLKTMGVTAEEIAYIGDDVNDVELMTHLAALGLVGAPADAEDEALRHAHYQCRRAGGLGAFREFADWILRFRTTES